jgi:hypothetical protein
MLKEMDVQDGIWVGETGNEEGQRFVPHTFYDDVFESPYPKYAGGRPSTYTLPWRQAIGKLALAPAQGHDLRFSTWSPSILAGVLGAAGMVDGVRRDERAL